MPYLATLLVKTSDELCQGIILQDEYKWTTSHTKGTDRQRTLKRHEKLDSACFFDHSKMRTQGVQTWRSSLLLHHTHCFETCNFPNTPFVSVIFFDRSSFDRSTKLLETNVCSHIFSAWRILTAHWCTLCANNWARSTTEHIKTQRCNPCTYCPHWSNRQHTMSHICAHLFTFRQKKYEIRFLPCGTQSFDSRPYRHTHSHVLAHLLRPARRRMKDQRLSPTLAADKSWHVFDYSQYRQANLKKQDKRLSHSAQIPDIWRARWVAMSFEILWICITRDWFLPPSKLG